MVGFRLRVGRLQRYVFADLASLQIDAKMYYFLTPPIFRCLGLKLLITCCLRFLAAWMVAASGITPLSNKALTESRGRKTGLNLELTSFPSSLFSQSDPLRSSVAPAATAARPERINPSTDRELCNINYTHLKPFIATKRKS